jgi:hypothetical protein
VSILGRQNEMGTVDEAGIMRSECDPGWWRWCGAAGRIAGIIWEGQGGQVRKRNLGLVIALLLAFSMALAGCGKSEEDAVKDSINGFVAAYNNADYEKCADYLQGVDDSNREEAMSTLGLAKAVVQEIEVISISNVSIEESTATAEVTARATMGAILGGQSAEETVTMSLDKGDGKWKFDFNALAKDLMAGITSMAG